MKLRMFTIGDAILGATLILSAIILFMVLPHLLLLDGVWVEVFSGQELMARYRLDEDVDFDVEGPLGKTSVRISSGRARIQYSPCPDKICMHMGSIGKEGGVLVCVPNRVVVQVGSSHSVAIDAVAR